MERVEGVETGVGQHRQEHAGEEPRDHRPAQDRQCAGTRLPERRLRRRRQAPRREQERGEQDDDERRKPPHPAGLEQKAARQHRDDVAYRAPHPHPPVAPDVEPALAADAVREQRLADRDDAGGEDEEDDRHPCHPGVAGRDEVAERGEQRAARRRAHEALAPAGDVGEPAPGVGREQSRSRLQRREHADRQGRVADALEPERPVGRDQPGVGEVGARDERERSDRPRGADAAGLKARARGSAAATRARRRTARDAAARGP